MAPRKPKPVSKFHPLKITCSVCGALPFMVCRPVPGDGWGVWDLKLCHEARIEESELEELFA